MSDIRYKLSHWPNGNLKSKVPYRADTIFGKAEYYDMDGVILFSQNYNYYGCISSTPYKNGLAHGIGENYNKSNMSAIGTNHFANGLNHGESKTYYYNEKLTTRALFENGLRAGLQISYYFNGSVRNIHWCSEGEIHGMDITYFEGVANGIGNIRNTKVFKNGKKHGPFVTYDIYKNIRYTFFYINSMPSSEEEFKLYELTLKLAGIEDL